ncbi:MAG: hypothetical protein ACKOOF_08825 [Planctomycetaceae bacterium]
MTSLDVLERVVAVLDDRGVDHMLVGAYSAIAYGLARATKDADFVVACEPRDMSGIALALGPDFSLERQIEFETLTNSKRNVIAVCFDVLDWSYLRRWTDQHGTTALLDQLRGEATE